MARGRAVVATGRGGSGEYLRDGDNCLLFDADDSLALASCVKALADDPELRARLREHGFETAPRHTEASFNEAVEDAVSAGVPALS
jgi:glycosyltransferase involved in cell wall biosynthesis